MVQCPSSLWVKNGPPGWANNTSNWPFWMRYMTKPALVRGCMFPLYCGMTWNQADSGVPPQPRRTMAFEERATGRKEPIARPNPPAARGQAKPWVTLAPDVARPRRGSYRLSLRSKISPARCGFALPWLAFITCPFRKFRAAALPPRKSFARDDLAGRFAAGEHLAKNVLRHRAADRAAVDELDQLLEMRRF